MTPLEKQDVRRLYDLLNEAMGIAMRLNLESLDSIHSAALESHKECRRKYAGQ